MMAGAAGKARRTLTVEAAHDLGPVRLHAVGLGRSVVHGMAVQTARILSAATGTALVCDMRSSGFLQRKLVVDPRFAGRGFLF
jgi:hypothetical protein